MARSSKAIIYKLVAQGFWKHLIVSKTQDTQKHLINTYQMNEWMWELGAHSQLGILSTELPISTSLPIYKVDFTISSPKSSLFLTFLSRLMPLSPNQTKTLGSAPSHTPKSPRPIDAAFW